jgi:hypothetical protein
MFESCVLATLTHLRNHYLRTAEKGFSIGDYGVDYPVVQATLMAHAKHLVVTSLRPMLYLFDVARMFVRRASCAMLSL